MSSVIVSSGSAFCHPCMAMLAAIRITSHVKWPRYASSKSFTSRTRMPLLFMYVP